MWITPCINKKSLNSAISYVDNFSSFLVCFFILLFNLSKELLSRQNQLFLLFCYYLTTIAKKSSLRKIKSRLRLFRARAVCAAYPSSPRGAHPCGAFCLIGISYQTKNTPLFEAGCMMTTTMI